MLCYNGWRARGVCALESSSYVCVHMGHVHPFLALTVCNTTEMGLRLKYSYIRVDPAHSLVTPYPKFRVLRD